MMKNEVSFEIPDEKMSQINDAVQVLADLLAPYKVVLTGEQRRRLSRIGDKSIATVEKVNQYADSHPEFVPNYAVTGDFRIDFAFFQKAWQILRPLMPIIEVFENAMIISGNEAWEFARAYYKSVREAAKSGIPGAQVIYDDLKPRFEKSSSEKNAAKLKP